MERHILGLAVGVFILIAAVALTPVFSSQLGRLEARLDLLHGKRQLKMCGGGGMTPREPAREFKRILLSEFGVETVPSPLCSTVLPVYGSRDGVIFERIRGYNEQQARELERIYGRDVVKETGAKVYLCYVIKNHAEYALTESDH